MEDEKGTDMMAAKAQPPAANRDWQRPNLAGGGG